MSIYGVRRSGLLLGLLLTGVFIGGSIPLWFLLIFGPLFVLWLITWDDVRLKQRRKIKKENYHNGSNNILF